MTCPGAIGDPVPHGFGFVGGSNACVGPTPLCPLGASKFQCGRSCCNPNRDQSTGKTCNFYQTPPAHSPDAPLASLAQSVEAQGWTDIGVVVSTEYAPVINYLTKSCQRCDMQPFRSSAECNGCRTDAGTWMESPNMGALPPRDDDGTDAPARYRTGGSPWLQRKASAYERKTMCTNSGIGYGFSGPRCCTGGVGSRLSGGATSNGMYAGQLHASGCKDNRCNQDLFYHPAVSLALPAVRRFRLFARPNECGSSRWQYAVAQDGVPQPLFLTLDADPRQPPWPTCASVDFNRQAWQSLVSGDLIYIPGQTGTFFVHLYMDDAVGPFRPTQSVFRGYSPVRPLRGKVWTPNSGLRNFTSLPSAGGLLRPF